mmetsp:Transcript_40457/g.114578  ORF Transcript_40457/g.114578 Transcript_40457/m.114578 type:complete len:351 (-) Transcript_40457:245-1297(-)|eukprot:CAMPEP_0117684930 /NCGR_PEP_ID=MMETSP0804-20121206/21428_1 /TAXON_ID=1074897 /ORGANISM="Tetraselmis astigmatica, Strain CCMP880" /LENGTH=350 /DNA_ID=CAMNT_0005496087 /DNA_START=196 /DNA_END=1248 /DNA_ORIENTATION=-
MAEKNTSAVNLLFPFTRLLAHGALPVAFGALKVIGQRPTEKKYLLVADDGRERSTIHEPAVVRPPSRSCMTERVSCSAGLFRDSSEEKEEEEGGFDWPAFGSSSKANSPKFTVVKGYKLGGWQPHRAYPNGWVDKVDLNGAEVFQTPRSGSRCKVACKPRVLVLYGSARERSHCRFQAMEVSRLLERLGFEVRVYSPTRLPMRGRDGCGRHLKVQELRYLASWSDAQVWCSPGVHNTYSVAFNNQIGWLPERINLGRSSHGRSPSVIMRVFCGSQTFSVVTNMHRQTRWMRLPSNLGDGNFTGKVWQEFEDSAEEGMGRMTPSPYRQRLVDAMKEFAKFTKIVKDNRSFS